MANPRKFSEKIALHNQKQAEETAAFEAIIRDVTAATRGSPSFPTQNQHLQLQQNIIGQYRAGSLPNVNQMVGNSAVDLQATLQHFEDIRGGPIHNRGIDRLHNRDGRGRQLGPHRRAFPMDKQRADCSPYGSAFLTPPPDSSWRRTNSDSALHTSAMAPLGDLGDHMHGATTPPVNRRLMEVAGENSMQGASLMKEFWDPKKLVAQSRPKSCEVPNINIYPSTEQENQGTGIHVPITNNTGSLPDLTVLHFPPPLTTPLDAEDQNYQGANQVPPGSAPANLSPTSAHRIGGMGPPSPQAQSPVQRRRIPHGGPSPLVLGGTSTQPIRISHSTPDSVPNIDPSKLPLDPRFKHQYLLYLRQQQRQRGAQPQTNHSPHTSPPSNSQRHQVPQVRITSACDQNNSQPSLTQYRNNVSESNCQSPTSPLSQTSHSPAQSPGLPPTSWNHSPFAENYQQQQQQTSALQHQFEQFNMSQDNHFISSSADSSLLTNGAASNSAIYTSPQNSTVNFSQAMVHGLSGSNQDLHQQQYFQQLDSEQISQNCVVNPAVAAQYQHLQQQQQQQNLLQQQQQQSHLSPSSKIPDIIFTGINSYFSPGIDDTSMLKQDFAKELGNAITGMPDGFDTDFFTSDEALKVGLDPLDLDGLQMLTDPSMITDPATEESFKLDRL